MVIRLRHRRAFRAQLGDAGEVREHGHELARAVEHDARAAPRHHRQEARELQRVAQPLLGIDIDRAAGGVLALPQRQRHAAHRPQLAIEPHRRVLEIEAHVIGGKAAREIAAGKQRQRPVPHDELVRRILGERAVETFDRRLVVAEAEIQQAEIVIDLGPRRIDRERAAKRRHRLVIAQVHPQHVAEIGMKRRRVRGEDQRALEAGDRGGQVLVALEDDGEIVVGVGHRREALDQLDIEGDGAVIVARALALVGAVEEDADFLGGRWRGGRRLNDLLSGLTHQDPHAGLAAACPP